MTQDLLLSPAEQSDELEKLACQLEASPRYRVSRIFEPETLFRQHLLPAEPTDRIGFAVVLDTETTGRDHAKDRIIELGMVSFAYDRLTGEVLTALETFNELEDPGFPIPEDATAVNGITDDMVKGKRINDMRVQVMVEMADFVIAHNSGFDRPFCEERWPFFKGKRWACSRLQMDWEKVGISSAKLEFIAFKMGFFYNAHRAESDCLALLHALSSPLPAPGEGVALRQVLANFEREDRRIWAVASPFEAKDVLKARGYRWSDGSKPGTEKAWWTEVSLADYEAEMAWLRQSVYNNRAFSVPVDRIDAFTRFTDRRDKLDRAYC